MKNNPLQFYFFMQTLLGGTITGLLYDLTVRGIFSYASNKTAARMVFLLSAFGVCLTCLISASDFYLRLYMGLGYAAGLALYFILFSAYVTAAIKTVLNFFNKASTKVCAPIKAAGVRFGVKHGEKISKIKTVFKKTRAIPNQIKIRYNKYVKYFLGVKKDGRPQHEYVSRNGAAKPPSAAATEKKKK